ncbi:MAG: hypothetical protein O3B24_00910 [Verrucomicrobia bacterium]|nr:hypothetical protein [Verrucomicrobiota bacterium]
MTGIAFGGLYGVEMGVDYTAEGRDTFPKTHADDIISRARSIRPAPGAMVDWSVDLDMLGSL